RGADPPRWSDPCRGGRRRPRGLGARFFVRGASRPRRAPALGLSFERARRRRMGCGMRRATAVALLVALALTASGQGRGTHPARARALARLLAASGGDARVHLDPATGIARSVRAARGTALGLARAAGLAEQRGRAAEFFRDYGAVFGISNAAAQLEEVRAALDRDGGMHLGYRQRHRGLPVFAGELRAHFDAAGDLVAVNGRIVPVDPVDTLPTRGAEEAGRVALAAVADDAGGSGALAVASASLVVFREGVLRDRPGPTHLAWEVDVGDGGSVREVVYVDAHTGKLV